MALSGAGVTKGSHRRERAAEKKKEKEKEKEKEGEPAKDGASSSKREGGGRRKEDEARARGGLAAASQPDVLSAPTILQREAKQAPPRASQQATPTDAVSGALASGDANPPTSTSRRHGRQGRGRGRGGNRGGAPPPTDS